ncbi:class I SAM-dependent methyltransferase [Shimia ponticola]|uniref:class I SAM-dependent methyltransferase n=1 Tax=Shimia ponticola TaxID=2582893 RepID=UPI0011BF97D3|nr:class I SAM-dependent methyltransferase [Shimia ponticola]
MNDDAEAIVGIYQRHATAFRRLRKPIGNERKWFIRFTALVPKGGTVLDLGCGFGAPVAEALVIDGATVTGVDTSASLLAEARNRLPDQTWIEADMRGLDLQQRFDGVLAWNSFFHLTPHDQRNMFSVFAQHAQPGAPLMFTSGPEASERIGEFEGEPLYHASLDPTEYRDLLNDAGFDVEAFVPEDPEAQGLTVWLALKRRT